MFPAHKNATFDLQLSAQAGRKKYGIMMGSKAAVGSGEENAGGDEE